jgi:hypothetical protein
MPGIGVASGDPRRVHGGRGDEVTVVTEPKLVDIFRRSGDANLGQTLIRLARLAETSHRYTVAQQMAEAAREDQPGIEGLNPRPTVAPSPKIARTRSAQAHTEVGS